MRLGESTHLIGVRKGCLYLFVQIVTFSFTRGCGTGWTCYPPPMLSTKDKLIGQLETARVKAGKTYQDVADDTGLHRFTVDRMLNKKSGITSDNLILVAESLGFRVVLVRPRKGAKP